MRRFVIWGGLEPPTDCLEGSCSIQLSYQTDLKNVVGKVFKTDLVLSDAKVMIFSEREKFYELSFIFAGQRRPKL